jgi:hypothetical protein
MVRMTVKLYERNIVVNATEDFLVMTTAKIPAGVSIRQILISPSDSEYGEYLRMFVSMDTEVIYTGRYVPDGINIEVTDGGYDEDRIVMFSLSCNLCPLDIRPYISEAHFKVKIVGEYQDGYGVCDDSVTSFDEEFSISWT